MKRKLLLGIVACSLILEACGGNQGNTETVANNGTVSEAESEKDGEQAENSKDVGQGVVIKKQNNGMFPSKASIAETVLLEQDGIKIIANSLEYSESRAILNLTIENNSNIDVSVYSGTLGYSMNTVNGCVIEGGYLNTDISSGMKAMEKIYYDSDELKVYGINDIAELGLSFYVDNDDSKTILKTDLLTIPTSIYDQIDLTEDTIKKSIEEGVWEKDFSLNLKYKNTDFKGEEGEVNINAVVIAESEDGDSSIFIELENATDDKKELYSSDIILNGIAVNQGRWSTYDIPARKKALIEFRLESLIDDEYQQIINKDNIGSLSFELCETDFDTFDVMGRSTISIVFDEKYAETRVEGNVIYDKGGITLKALPIMENDYNQYIIPLFVSNNSGEEIRVDTEMNSLSVDGYMLDSYSMACSLADGQEGVLAIEVYKDKASELQINSIEDFVSATCKLNIKNSHYNDIDSATIEMQF